MSATQFFSGSRGRAIDRASPGPWATQRALMPFKPSPTSSPALRLVIADHQALIRSAIRLLLETAGDHAVVAEAADGQDTLDKVAGSRPDIVLLDVAMPKMSGIEVTKRIRDNFPTVKVLALTALEGEVYVRAALAAGAAGYVPKTAEAVELLDAIRVVASGSNYVHPSLAAALLTPLEKSSIDPLAGLTSRETEVIRLLALGHSHKEVAAHLGISVKTVETHKGRLMQKLGLYSRVDIVRLAAEHGWIRAPVAMATIVAPFPAT